MIFPLALLPAYDLAREAGVDALAVLQRALAGTFRGYTPADRNFIGTRPNGQTARLSLIRVIADD